MSLDIRNLQHSRKQLDTAETCIYLDTSSSLGTNRACVGPEEGIRSYATILKPRLAASLAYRLHLAQEVSAGSEDIGDQIVVSEDETLVRSETSCSLDYKGQR